MMILNLAGCADILSSLTPPWKEMAITDAKSVAGKWEGLLTRLPRSWRDDWVSITIGEDGSYVWANYRQIGAFSGQGRLQIIDGRFATVGERGRAAGTLHVAGDRRMLRVVGRSKDGLEDIAELEPARYPPLRRLSPALD
jgi:hypothetical protein